MSRVHNRITIFATIILGLGFAATNATGAFAKESRTRGAVRYHTVRYHIDYERSVRGYAGPLYSVGDDCDLPSSACSNDERISN